MATKPADGDVVTIKKYANRRLYNTATSSYVTLDDLCKMVQEGTEFRVFDAKTGDDLTRTVLTQIIVEEEQKGQHLLPIGFLRQVIGLYGDNMRWMLPHYLDNMMSWYSDHQEQVRDRMSTSLGPVFGGSMEEIQRQNMAMVEQAFRIFNPFAGTSAESAAASGSGGQKSREKEAPKSPAEQPDPRDDGSISELREQVAAMQRQLDAMSRVKGDD